MQEDKHQTRKLLLGGNARNKHQQEIISVEPYLRTTSTSYCYREFEPSDVKDDHHIDRVKDKEEDGEDEAIKLVEAINPYMTHKSYFKICHEYS